jgi:hypothetical protein
MDTTNIVLSSNGTFVTYKTNIKRRKETKFKRIGSITSVIYGDNIFEAVRTKQMLTTFLAGETLGDIRSRLNVPSPQHFFPRLCYRRQQQE